MLTLVRMWPLGALATATFMTSSTAEARDLPSNLRCEFLTNPNLVDKTQPRLSWIVQNNRTNWKQSAFRIVVASNLATLNGKPDLWDSGKVEGMASSQIPYQGHALASNQEYFWKVQVWDKEGHESEWSKPARWETGLLRAEDWRDSKWIGTGKEGSAPFLRREFSISGPVKRARLFACGLGYAELHLNGQKLEKDVERDPGYTNFGKRVLYVAHDVTGLLKHGKNTLGAILGTGWYDVHDIATWHFERAPWRDRPKARLLLSIEYRDGHHETIGSDETWRATTGPILTDGIYSGETYDSRKEMPGWDRVGFSENGWSPASILAAPKGDLVALSCPPIAITKTFAPIGIKEAKPGVFIVDFGQNFSGHVRLKVNEPSGTKITLRYSERVGKDDMIDRSQIEQFMDRKPPQLFQEDTYICKGGGPETWEQIFSYSGFRYVEVTGFPGTPNLANFEGRFAHTDLESAGNFSCSNDLLNKIQTATRYSYLSNAQSIFTDCPQREKNGWTGDAHLAAEAGLMNFHSATLYEKWLEDLHDDQKPDGKMSVIVPTGGWGFGASHPAWDSAYPIIVNDMYRYLGDKKVIERHYDKVKHYVDGLETQTKEGVIDFDSLGDWLPWSTETSSKLTSTAFLYLDQTLISRFARILGKTDEASKYAEHAEKTKVAFNAVFTNKETGLYDNGSQAALSTAVFFGVVPEERKSTIFNGLVADVEKQGHIDTGIIGAKNLLRVLSENGRTDLAYKLVARKEQPGWGWWIEQGATTLWEDWKGESSLNHIMFGDVSNWFFQWIAGIGLDPESPAFEHILIRPQPVGDLTWAKADYEAPNGKISSSWTLDKGRFHLSVTIPPNSTATVILPGKPKDGKTSLEIGSGHYEFDSQIS